MEKWEYIEIWVNGKEWWDSMNRSGSLVTFRRHYPNSAPLLNELGQQGWEVVSFNALANFNYFDQEKYLLKRKLA